MGSFDGAELCELTGLYILSELESLINKDQMGLYRDDGLAVLNLSGPKIEKLRKSVIKLFKQFNLSVTIMSNISSTEFLDVWFDLKQDIYKPYRKENDLPVYIDKLSNHPKVIKNQLPSMISNRISKLSCSETVFNQESSVYQDALKNAGYNDRLVYTKEADSQEKLRNKRKRTRNIIWFNPPYSENVKTNIGRRFLSLIDKHFGSSDLKKYFNRQTIKVSYSCMPNLESYISEHNKILLKESKKVDQATSSKPSCNCKQGVNACPLNGHCLKKSLVYKASVTSTNASAVYYGLTSDTFKTRFNNHQTSFKNERYKESTTLSGYVWELKQANQIYDVKWEIAANAPTYNPASKRCHLCLTEKAFILNNDHNHPLNKRSELLGVCRHRRKHLLSSCS